MCLTIITWYTSFACGRAAIQTQGCALTTQGGLTFDFTGLGLTAVDVNATNTPQVGDSYLHNTGMSSF